jgi:Tfp pilus assembly protein PilX
MKSEDAAHRDEKGALLLAAVFLIVVVGFLGTIVVALVGTQSFTSVNEVRSTEALYVAEGGLERARYAFDNGTACGSLAFTQALGNGTFTTSGTAYAPPTTTLTANITNSQTTIPVASVASYASHGRVQIDSETIDYGRTSTLGADCSPVAAPCLISATRGKAGTTAAAHLSGASVSQNLCMIRSTGTVTASPGTGQRVVEVAAQAGGGSAYTATAGPGTVLGTTETTIDSLATTLPAGDNLIIVAVSFRNTTDEKTIAAGDLKLKKGAAVLASNQYVIKFGDSPPSGSDFPQRTAFLLYKDVGSTANPTYTVTAELTASGGTTSAGVKILVINNPPNSSFEDGPSVDVGTSDTTVLSHASTVPAGTNVVLAAVQLNNASGTQTVGLAVGELDLRRGATVLATNMYQMNFSDANDANPGNGVLLIARDAGAPANPTYTVLADATITNRLDAEVKIIVLNGLTSAFAADDDDSVPAALTTITTLATGFPAGETIVIAANQYENDNSAQRNFLAGNDQIAENGTSVSSSIFDLNLCGSPNRCDDFAAGLFWRNPVAPANPTYVTRVQPSGTGVDVESKIVAISIQGGMQSVDWVEVPQ